MNLYNLYEQAILEVAIENDKSKMTSSVDIKNIQDAIRNNFAVNISYYDDKTKSYSKSRYCQVLAIGKTSQQNVAIRVYQISGPNLKKDKNGKTIRWKTFLKEKIPANGFKITKMRFYAPPDELYNTLGDKTLNIPDSEGLANMAVFKEKNLEKYRSRYDGWKSDLESKTANKPLTKDRGEEESEEDSNANKFLQNVNPTFKSMDNNNDKNADLGNDYIKGDNDVSYPTDLDYKDSNLYANKVVDDNEINNI